MILCLLGRRGPRNMLNLIRFSVVLCFAVALLLPSVSNAKLAVTNRKDRNMRTNSQNKDEASLRARAEKLHRDSIVVDTHNDITTPMIEEGFDLGMDGADPKAKIKTHTDLKRMKAGGL